MPTTQKDCGLKRYDSLLYTVVDPERAKLQAIFFLRAGQFLESHTFDSAFERDVWELYAQGRGDRYIVEEINRRGSHITLNARGTKLKTANRANVRAAINKTKTHFRKYLLAQSLEQETEIMEMRHL